MIDVKFESRGNSIRLPLLVLQSSVGTHPTEDFQCISLWWHFSEGGEMAHLLQEKYSCDVAKAYSMESVKWQERKPGLIGEKVSSSSNDVSSTPALTFNSSTELPVTNQFYSESSHHWLSWGIRNMQEKHHNQQQIGLKPNRAFSTSVSVLGWHLPLVRSEVEGYFHLLSDNSDVSSLSVTAQQKLCLVKLSLRAG